MFMAVKDFLAPTRGRILLFVIIFVLVFLYDTAFAPFPGSPVVDNLATQEGASSFVLYILLLPYILSCLIPAFLGLRKRKFIRMLNLTHFMQPRPEHHPEKPTSQQTFVFPSGTEVQESHLQGQLEDVEESMGAGGKPQGARQGKPSPEPVAKPTRKPSRKASKTGRKPPSRKPAKRTARKAGGKK